MSEPTEAARIIQELFAENRIPSTASVERVIKRLLDEKDRIICDQAADILNLKADLMRSKDLSNIRYAEIERLNKIIELLERQLKQAIEKGDEATNPDEGE